MKPLGIRSRGSSCRHMFVASVRVRKLGSLDIHLLWLQTLLLILLAGQASSDQTTAASTPALSLPTTAAQTSPSVRYFISVTVNVTEEEEEKEEEEDIKAWLVNVFQNKLKSCVATNYETTTATPNYTQTTSANISYVTTLMTTELPTLKGNNTTTATTTKTTLTSLQQHSDTTATSILENSSITTKATTLESNNPTTAKTHQSTAAVPTQDHSLPSFPATAITQEPKSGQVNSIRRIVRDIRTVTQSSGISNDTAGGLFQSINISCAMNTSITHTECSVRLELKEAVPACCILRTLCEASDTSSDIHVVGNKAYKEQTQNDCNSNPQEETSCTYTGQVTKSCQESGYVAGQNNCDPVVEKNSCSCSDYCHRKDAYYTFQMSVTNLEVNTSYISSLISEKLEQARNCTPNANVSCPLSIVAYEYKNASATCGSIVTNCQNCSVILGFYNEVPICTVAAAMLDVFQSQNQISYNGLVTRAAICGNVSLTPQFTWVKLKPAAFCMAIQGSNNFTCKNGENVVVQLDDQCALTVFTTPSPNVTTTQPNVTTLSVNATLLPLNTTAGPLNATTTAANATVPVTPSKNTTTEDAALSQANALLELTRDVSKLNSSQVDQLVSNLENLLLGPNISLALGNISIHIVSNLLSASPETLAHSSNSIIGVVDTVGLKMVLDNKAETLLSPAVALSAKPADGTNFQETFFSISDPNNVQVSGNPRLRRSVTTHSSIPEGSIQLPPSLTHGLTPEQQQLATRVQFSFYQKSTVFQDTSMGQRKLISGILGASVANLSITGLKDNVVIYLRHTEPTPANFVAACVFWDFTLNNSSGGWNPTGCYVQNSTDNETVCGCNHMTSFAILLDLSRQSVISPLQATILTFITYIGCGISAIFLSITLLTYLAFEKLRKDIPSKILIQLCLALLLLNMVFLVDAWLALYPNAVGLCISTAWFLHYFLLVSFTWMGLEGVHMYNALVKVFNNNISHYMLKFSLVGWGIPMAVVIIVIAIDKKNYGLVSYGKFTDGRSDDFCWLKSDVAFYVAVVAYFCVIFLFNLIMFTVVLVQLSRIKRQNPHNVQHRSTLENVRSVAGITFLLGLTWGFAFFAWGPVNLAFTYLFAIFNSLQGFFIFVFYCAVKENVRRQWRTYLCCGTMRLAENSEWSRTATQKTVKKSSTNKQTALHSLKSSQSNSSSSSSSFLVSDSSEQIHGISSPFDDRAITADENGTMDVILNEINKQHSKQQDP